MTTTLAHISASIGTPSTCTPTPGARDYDVSVTIDAVETRMEVTLIPDGDPHETLTAWGSLDHWLSATGVRLLHTYPADVARQLASAIEAACSSEDERELEIPQPATTTVRMNVRLGAVSRGDRIWWVTATTPDAALAEILRESETLGFRSHADLSGEPDADGLRPAVITFEPLR